MSIESEMEKVGRKMCVKMLRLVCNVAYSKINMSALKRVQH
jgi:hypothetical protein